MTDFLLEMLVVILLAILSSLITIYISGNSHAFWTGGKIRRFILHAYMKVHSTRYPFYNRDKKA